jgi:hypothetical protein
VLGRQRTVDGLGAAGAVALAALVATAGCRRSSGGGGPPGAVGFTLDLPGETLRGGAITTSPPGREESMVGALANASLAWARACRELAAANVNVDLALALAADGRVREARPRSPTPLGACLARAAAETRPPNVALPGDTEVSLALAFATVRPAAAPPTAPAR